MQGPRPRSWVPDWVEGKGPPTEGALSVSLPSASRRPASPDQRVVYTVLECQPLFDSSDMTITEWVQIAQTIEVTGEPGEGWGVVGRGGVWQWRWGWEDADEGSYLSGMAPATLSPAPWVGGGIKDHVHCSGEEVAQVAVSL